MLHQRFGSTIKLSCLDNRGLAILIDIYLNSKFCFSSITILSFVIHMVKIYQQFECVLTRTKYWLSQVFMRLVFLLVVIDVIQGSGQLWGLGSLRRRVQYKLVSFKSLIRGFFWERKFHEGIAMAYEQLNWGVVSFRD